MRTPGANGYDILATPGEFSVLPLFQWHYNFLPLYSRAQSWSVHPGNSSYLVSWGPNLPFTCTYNISRAEEVIITYAICSSCQKTSWGPNLPFTCTYNISRAEEVIITYALCSSCQKTSYLTHTLFMVLQLLLTERYARHWWYVMNTTRSCLPPSDFFLTTLVSFSPFVSRSLYMLFPFLIPSSISTLYTFISQLR